MPGLYLAAIVVSAAGIAALDLRFGLVARRARRPFALALVAGLAFFIAWDLVGIATGVFVKGDSPLYLGLDLAPHLPLEELFFLAFLCYLTLVVHAAALRMLTGRRARRQDAAGSVPGAGGAQ